MNPHSMVDNYLNIVPTLQWGNVTKSNSLLFNRKLIGASQIIEQTKGFKQIIVERRFAFWSFLDFSLFGLWWYSSLYYPTKISNIID